MNKRMIKNSFAVAGIALMLGTTAEASPAFARQMGSDCMSCHAQYMPKLNAFGREFSKSGFTMSGTSELQSTESGGLALPANLNMAFVVKARYLSVDGKNGIADTPAARTTYQHFEAFDEVAFIFGGKVAENVGSYFEWGGPASAGKIKLAFPTEIGRIGATVYMSDGFGAFAGTEFMTTGLYRPIRTFESRSQANIFQRLLIGNGSSQGIAATYDHNGFSAVVGQYVPVYGNSTDTTEAGMKTMLRANYEANFSGFDVTVGGFYIGGDVRDNNLLLGKVDAFDAHALNLESNGFDLQVEGNVNDMSLMITAGYVLNNSYTASGIPGLADTHDDDGFSISASLFPIDTWGAKIAYLSTNDNLKSAVKDTSVNIVTLGTDYNLAQNVKFTVEYAMSSFDSPASTKDETQLLTMLNIAF